MLGESIRFDDTSSRFSNSDQSVPLGGVPRALRTAAETAGLDPRAELYNEALRYATEGHLRLARERLQMLLCMCPDDGESRLLYAKVQVASQKWNEALAALDEAQACGLHIPTELRRAVEDHLRAEEAAKEEERAALRAREQGEIKALRQEARRLRSENAALLGRSSELERETRKWAWTTAGVSSMAILFIIANLAFGGSEEAGVVTQPPPMVATSPTLLPAAMIPEAPTPPTDLIATQAAEALRTTPLLEGTNLEVTMTAGEANVSGSVINHYQLKELETILSNIDGIDSVSIDKVANDARERGGKHTVQSGDTLSHIAYYYYGDASLTAPILKANRGSLGGRANLSIDQVLKIPSVQ
jgi:nucleoid-associated protein YgaU